MKLCISALGHARRLTFIIYVQLLSINQIFQYRYSRVILCSVGEVNIFEHGLYILALEHARMLILSNYVLLAFKNKNSSIFSCLREFVTCRARFYIWS